MSRSVRFLLIATLVSLAALIASAVCVWSWRAELPDPVASHWSGSGAADGYSALGEFVLLLTGTMTVGVLLVFLLGLAVTRNGTGVRVTVGFILYLGILGAVLQVTTVAPQRGLPSAQGVELPGWFLAVTLLGPVLPAVVVALLVPRAEVPDAQGPPPTHAEYAPLEDGKVPSWQGSTSMGASVRWAILALVTGSGLCLAALMGAWTYLIEALTLGGLVLALGGLVLAMSRFTLTADASGMTVRSWLGWPRKEIGSSKISLAQAVQVQPLGDFGGWGWRFNLAGEQGIVLRTGPGVRISYGAGRVLVVTVDEDAQGLAATLNSAARRAHGLRVQGRTGT